MSCPPLRCKGNTSYKSGTQTNNSEPMTTFKTGLGPNHHCLQHHHLRRNPPPTTPKKTLFYVPHNCKRLTDWAFPCIDNSNNAPNTTYADNDNDTISFDSTLPEPHSSEWTDKIANGDISWNSRPSSAPSKDNLHNESTTIVQNNDDDTIPFNSTLPEPHSLKWTNKIVNGNISWNLRPSSASPKDNPCNESTTVVQRKAPPSSSTA